MATRMRKGSKASTTKDKAKESLGFNKVTEPIVVAPDEKEPVEGMDVKAERENLFKSWKRLVTIANTLLDQAEIDPLAVKASMMAQIVRVLSQSGKVISDYEAHLRKVDTEPVIDPETGEPEMSTDEEAMLAEWDRREALTEDERLAEDLAEHAKIMANPPTRKDSDTDNDVDLNHGLNFRRDN